MKIFKYLLFLLLIAFIAGSLYIATKDGDFQFEESRLIEAPPSLLFQEVNDYRNWPKWSYWKNREDLELDLTKATQGVGAGFSWEAAEMNDGAIYTENVIPEKKITQKMVLESTISGLEGELYWDFQPSNNGTQVTWGMKGDLGFRQKLALSLQDLDLSDLLRPKFRQGLQDLEKTVLSQMLAYSINIDGSTQHGGGYYLYTTASSRIEEVNKRSEPLFEQVNQFMAKNGIPLNGRPFILFNKRNPQQGTTIFSAAVPTSNQVITPLGSDVLNGYLPAQKMVKTTLKGHHKNFPEAWQKTLDFIDENDLKMNQQGEPLQVFIRSSKEEENPALWISEIYIPIQ